jgi:hypothetical protein
MVLGSVQHAFKDRKIGNHTSCIEVFESVEDDRVALCSYLQVIIPWINGSSDEEVLRDDQLL